MYLVVVAEQDFNNRAHFQGAISWVVSISAPLSPYILQLRFSMKTSISFLSAAGPQTVDGLVAALASIMITMKRVDYDASLLANSFFVGGLSVLNFDVAQRRILCNTGNLVCDSTLIVASAHLSKP